jgi:Zn-dependent peptidase ImmA (M78 family)
MEFDAGQLVSRPRAEVIANKFAASILMPEAILRDAWRMTAQLPDCAALLGVSLQSLKIRLHEFEMI